MTASYSEKNDKEQSLQEVEKLKDLANTSFEQETATKDTHVEQKVREPIMKSMTAQTKFITSYGWRQSDTSVIIYINLEDISDEFSKEKCLVVIQAKSIDLTILEHKRASHKFKIGSLYDCVETEVDPIIKFRKDRIIISLKKANPNKHWTHLKESSTQQEFNMIERKEKQYKPTKHENISSPF